MEYVSENCFTAGARHTRLPTPPPQIPAKEGDPHQSPRGVLRPGGRFPASGLAACTCSHAASKTGNQRTNNEPLLNGASGWFCLFTVMNGRFGTALREREGAPAPSCTGDLETPSDGGGRKPRRGVRAALVKGLNIGVAHIFQGKRAESPTQTPLCGGDAQAGASKAPSRTWR